MGKKDKRELADMFKALGDPTRLKIYRFLRGRCWPHAADEVEEKWLENGPTVSEVCSKVTGSKKITSKVSQHLKELRLAGLVTIERRGKNMICGINQEAVNALTSLLNSVEEIEAAVPEAIDAVEPAVVSKAVVETAPIVGEAALAEHKTSKIRKKPEQLKTVELPVVDVEIVKSRRKPRAATVSHEPPAQSA